MKRYDSLPGPLMAAAALLAVAGLLAGGCGGKRQASPQMVPEVAALTLKTQRIELTTELPGRTTAYRTAEIRPQVSGIIRKRLFEEGTNVQAGQLLYQIDPSSFQAAFDNAKAALGRAEANLPAIRSRADRYKELLESRAVSRQDYDDAAAALKQAEADVEFWKASVASARVNLEHTRIAAPISGRIGRSEVTDGALAAAYQPLALATVQQLDPIYVDVPQSTAELLALKARAKDGRIQSGENQRSVKILLEDGTAYPREGKLQFRDVTVDPTTGSVNLRIVVPNPQGVLLPGMFVRAVIKEGVNKNAILVPQQSVARDPKGNPSVLLVASAGKVEQRPVVLDRAVGSDWLVSKGLAAGDNVVVEGMQKVRPGASVKVVPLAAAPAK
ncbi:MAG: efflux RND transporter periplasmic adaptor subunit [Thermodesulfobacteriota bacterium]